VFPISFFKYFSGYKSVKKRKSTCDQLTQPSALHFLCRDPKDRYHLHHDLNNYVRHFRGRWDPSIDIEPAKEVFDPIEQFDELVLAGAYIFGSLGELNVKTAQGNPRRYEPRREHRLPQR
jgi:hypothetical protein